MQSRRPRCGGAREENLISDAGRDTRLCCAADCVHNLVQLAAAESKLPFASTLYGAWSKVPTSVVGSVGRYLHGHNSRYR